MNFRTFSALVSLVELDKLKKNLCIPKSNNWFLFHELDGQQFWLEYKNHFAFHVDNISKKVSIYHLSKSKNLGLDHYIQTQLKSFLLCLSDQEGLHGTALIRNSACIVLLGNSGQGKSTLAAYLLTQGWKLLSDDLIEFSENLDHITAPPYTYLKLYPSDAKRFQPSGELVGRLNKKTKKQMWKYNMEQKNYQPTAFILLDSSADKLSFEQLFGQQAFLAMHSSAFNTAYWNESRYRNSLTIFSDLAKKFPVYKLSYPKKYSSFPQIKKVLDGLLNELITNGSSLDTIPTQLTTVNL